jgi:hypothetical protein
MMYTYIFGVVILQWVVIAYLAYQDPSQACFMKVLHMDALAACVTLPEESKNTWNLLHLARTFGEDIPQALYQYLFVTKVKKNKFMILSICISLGSSCKALYDSCNRALEAAGAYERVKGLDADELGTKLTLDDMSEIKSFIEADVEAFPEAKNIDQDVMHFETLVRLLIKYSEGYLLYPGSRYIRLSEFLNLFPEFLNQLSEQALSFLVEGTNRTVAFRKVAEGIRNDLDPDGLNPDWIEVSDFFVWLGDKAAEWKEEQEANEERARKEEEERTWGDEDLRDEAAGKIQ